MNVYEVLLESQAQRDLRAFPPSLADRVIRRIRSLAVDPRSAGCRKLAGSVNDWRVRVGDYRIIYTIDDAAQEVRVMYVRHRRNAYR
jgi:mRNA interferase RelE/StbE